MWILWGCQGKGVGVTPPRSITVGSLMRGGRGVGRRWHPWSWDHLPAAPPASCVLSPSCLPGSGDRRAGAGTVGPRATQAYPGLDARPASLLKRRVSRLLCLQVCQADGPASG